MPKRVCIIGCGTIGSLYAAHLSRVAETYAFVRRPQHAEALNHQGLRVSGKRDFTGTPKASTDPATLPEFDLGILATKCIQTREAIATVAHLFKNGAVLSAQNGLGNEEIVAAHTRSYVMRGTTFMSGSRHGDTHVEMELDTPTWLGPFEPTNTPFSLVEEAAALLVEGGLKAEALEDARPAQWAKLIFNSAVNVVAALTELPHCPLFSKEDDFSDLGRLLHELINEGKAVAAALGVELREDPWEMNKIGALTNHPPSMLYDVKHCYLTEVDFLTGAIAREAERAGVSAPLHNALYRLVKGKEASWTWQHTEPPR